MSDLVQKVRQKREDIWVDEPQEVRDAFLKSKGVGDSSFFPLRSEAVIMYCTLSGTQCKPQK